MEDKIKKILKDCTDDQLNSYAKAAKTEHQKYENLNFKMVMLSMLGLVSIPFGFIMGLPFGIGFSIVNAGLYTATLIVNSKYHKQVKKLDCIKKEREARERVKYKDLEPLFFNVENKEVKQEDKNAKKKSSRNTIKENETQEETYTDWSL